jgi:hypothetical protein
MNGPWIEQTSKGNFSYRKLHLSSLLLLILLTIFSVNQSGLLVIGGVLSLGMLERPDVKVKKHFELTAMGINSAYLAFCIVLWR